MNFIGDIFALVLIGILSLFYFDNRHYLTRSSRYFAACLIATGATALTDLCSIALMNREWTPLWVNMTINTWYFIVNVICTMMISVFLFCKVLEHVHDRKCELFAKYSLWIIGLIYLSFVITNLWTGWLFSFDENMVYHRGPLNAIGYIAAFIQLGCVMACYIKNRKNVNMNLRIALTECCPIIVFCIIIQLLYPEVMLNGVFMAMVNLVIYLNFQGQRGGKHRLTQLNDRHSFFKELERRIPTKKEFSVYTISIKHFGEINRKLGHKNGDEVLFRFAIQLEKLIPDSISFHMNGTVFALVIPIASPEDAPKNTEKLTEFLKKGIDYLGQRIVLDAVLVDCLVDSSETNATEFYERLEYAAALAHEERVDYIRYSQDIGRQMERCRYLNERMQTIDRLHGFDVWFQPSCTVRDNSYQSMEALIRLRESDGSMISPGEFIPIAEKSHHICHLTWFVLEEVCRTLAEYPEFDGTSVSVNLPMYQLMQPDFEQTFNGFVDKYGIAHNRICIEFTERVILDDLDKIKESMFHLSEQGYRFYLDDFGIGYSNFNCLLELPFSCIKLDQSLTQKEKRDDTHASLAHSLIRVFHDMGLEVIAEGAETQEQVDLLKEYGVDKIQGYYFAKPMDLHTLLQFFRKKKTEKNGLV